MALNHCARMVPLVGRRLAGLPLQQPARTLFSPWPRTADVGALIRDMDRQMDRLERELFRGLPSLLPRSALPLSAPIDHTLAPHEGQYRVAVDLSGFRPEEINLSLDESGRRLTVAAKCERRGRDGSHFAQEVSRVVTLPEAIDTDKLSSTLHRDGVLAIEAPFKDQPQQHQQQEPLSIPIQRTGEQPQLQQQQQQESKAETPSSSSS